MTRADQHLLAEPRAQASQPRRPRGRPRSPRAPRSTGGSARSRAPRRLLSGLTRARGVQFWGDRTSRSGTLLRPPGEGTPREGEPRAAAGACAGGWGRVCHGCRVRHEIVLAPSVLVESQIRFNLCYGSNYG